MALPHLLARLLVRTGIAGCLPSVKRLVDGGSAYLHYYSDQVFNAPFKEVAELSAFNEYKEPDGIDLSCGAPAFDLLPSASTKLPADRRGWPVPAGLPELRGVVAERLLSDNHVVVNPADEVLITNGAAGAYSVALDAFVNAGDSVVLFDPTSPLFALALRQRRAKIRWLETWSENGRTRFHLEHLAKALHRARLIVVNSPCNPTGCTIAPEDLEQIAWWAERRDVLIYGDESFHRFHYEGEPVCIGSLPSARRRTLTVGSVSKSHALSSARVGWLAGNRHLVRPCLVSSVLHTPFVPTLCQQLAVTALRLPTDGFVPLLAEFESRRRYVYERLRSMDLNPIWPTGAFFFWLPVWEFGLSGRQFAEELRSAMKVQVTPGHLYGPSGAGYVRLSYAVEDGRLREGLNRLAAYVEEARTMEQQPMKQAA